MVVTFYSSKPYDERYFKAENSHRSEHDIIFQESRLNRRSAPLAIGSRAICAFVNDRLDRPVLEQLKEGSTEIIAMRCAGFNNVDLAAAEALGFTVVRVPAYSPHAVAEHTLGLLLALNRHLHRAYNRVREGNFSLEGLVGAEIFGSTVGIVGTGMIGTNVARMFHGLGCRLLCHDVEENPDLLELGAEYRPLEALLGASDVVTLHCPLVEATHHMINHETIGQMKHGAALLNTSRGGLIDTAAVIEGLKSGRIGRLGIDVYEEEDNLFFEDHSYEVVQDDLFARLQTFPNVIITGHQAFFTDKALRAIAKTTLANLSQLEAGEPCENAVRRPA